MLAAAAGGAANDSAAATAAATDDTTAIPNRPDTRDRAPATLADDCMSFPRVCCMDAYCRVFGAQPRGLSTESRRNDAHGRHAPLSCPGRVQRAHLRERNETRDPAQESRSATLA